MEFLARPIKFREVVPCGFTVEKFVSGLCTVSCESAVSGTAFSNYSTEEVGCISRVISCE
jgi:hypothetical protein